jgi:hypothetical protein
VAGVPPRRLDEGIERLLYRDITARPQRTGPTLQLVVGITLRITDPETAVRAQPAKFDPVDFAR